MFFSEEKLFRMMGFTMRLLLNSQFLKYIEIFNKANYSII